MKQKKKEWFKLKSYPHIGPPIKAKDKQKVCNYIKNKDKIASHAFLPFIHKVIVSRKYRKEYDDLGNLLHDGKRQKLKPKKRDIYFANHWDASIFSYYGHLLNKQYDKELKKRGINEVVTAYRQIPIYQGDEFIRNKCNIDFANDVFNFIRSKKNEETVAIAFDIEGFFDNLKHNKIKRVWCELFNWKRLNKDHYNVFKNITKFAHVEEKQLFELFQDKIIVETKTGIQKTIEIAKINYLYNQNAIAYCELKDINLIRRKGLIRSNKYHKGKLKDFGICQGSPISSVLANLYMIDFDELIHKEVNAFGGLYRRYSDDMVIVCKAKHKQKIIDLMEEKIKDLTDLNIQGSKTQVFQFFQKSGKLVCSQEFKGVINTNSENRNFEYLGFSFDGEITSLKTSSLAKYYRKMKLNVRRCNYYAAVIKNETRGQIFQRRLYKRFSYIGAKRKRKYERVRGTTDQWRISKKYNWGNYITYAKLASKTLENNNVKSQIKKHWKNLNDYKLKV
jgi:hypothetical protein